MARSLLILVLFIISCSYAYDYEVIRNNYKNSEITTVYLNNVEVLSLAGSDVKVLKRAYGFLSRLIQYKNLRYNTEGMVIKRNNNKTTEFLWDEQSLIKLSIVDEGLNQSRNNNLEKIKTFLSSIKNGINNNKILYTEKGSSYKGISILKEMNLSDFKNWEMFPAVHAFLPLGTKIRIYTVIHMVG